MFHNKTDLTIPLSFMVDSGPLMNILLDWLLIGSMFCAVEATSTTLILVECITFHGTNFFDDVYTF